MIDEEQKKRLTEFIEECWYEAVQVEPSNVWICKNCGWYFHSNRTFDTWPDLGACMEALVREGLWEEFFRYGYDKWLDSNIDTFTSKSKYTQWLLRPVNEAEEAHFCALVAEFLEAKDG